MIRVLYSKEVKGGKYLRDFNKELSAYGLTKETYEACLEDIKDKYLGINDMDWQELTEKYNLDIHYDTLRKASQTIFGNIFVTDYFKDKYARENSSNTYLEEIKQAKVELAKERQKLRDERTDYQRSIREDARRESFIETIERTLKQEIEPLKLNVRKGTIESDDDLIVCLSDLHAGIEVKNAWNYYNSNVLQERLNKYLSKVLEIQETHKCKNCEFVIGGDSISGLIHTSLRLQNNEDCIQQLKIAIEYIAEFISKLQPYFEQINVYGVAGNHSRLSPIKEDGLKGENLEEMLLYCLALKFSQTDNVKIISEVESRFDNSIIHFKTRGGKMFYVVHGDKDCVSNVVQNLTLMTGIKPSCVIMGHRHSNGLTTVHGTKIVQCGSVVGTDDYCVDKRISGTPEQVCIVTNKNETIKCLYDIQL